MHPNRLLPIFLLAVAGMDFLLAMHPKTDGAETSGASTTNIHNEQHHHKVDYEGTIDSDRVGSSGEPTEFLFVDVDYEDTIDSDWVGSSGEPTEFLFVDTNEIIALNYGPEYHLKLKNVQIRLGDKQFRSAISKHKHKSPSAARIELTLDEQQNLDLNAPKDLEGIELEIVYGIGEDCKKPGCPDHGISHINWMYKLRNGKDEKKVTVKIPKMENAPTEEEKEILKGIFIGGHKFKVEVLSDGNAGIKFQKKLSPGKMKFTADYTKVRTGNGEMVEVSYKEGKNWDLDLESISLPKSTFTINWATAGIKEVEEMRTVVIHVYFKLKDGEGKHNKVTESERGGRPLLRQIPLRDLKEDILEQLFVGGQLATIYLSKVDYKKNEIEIGAAPAVTKPKSDLTPGTMKFTVGYRNLWSEKGQMVKEPFAYQKDYEFENISLPESTFTINWAKSNIKEVEQLRAVRIGIEFKLEDGEYMTVPKDQRGVYYSRTVSFQDLSNDILEQLFVGGETTIHLSKVDHGKSGIEIVAGPKPKSSVFETVKTYGKSLVGI